MLGRLKGLFAGKEPKPRRRVAADPTVETVLAPGTPFCAIGDVHGCLDLLEPLYTKLRQEFGQDIPIVFLGDAIDRGPNSAGTLAFIRGLCVDSPDRHVNLMGNHEKMMLDFIDDPAGRGLRWLTFGGIETLASFGIQAHSKRPDVEDAVELVEQLEDAMPDGMQDWIRQLPARWSTGNLHCVHAGMDPDRAVDDQSRREMINGHPAFLEVPRDDGQTIVHGHTVMAEATIGDCRISIDTGAYFTGTLTAAHIDADACRFIT
ncbi:metallophosphoesterase [Pseudooceanicola onchidii]|uniref:metallophosphoesterase n=1 Tax=Pseudooceanicola onchidii TaxID=2562279 RepID=UPI0010AAE644|nr:metallophosphoesterase [Pseudooceanicola onchidii]